MCKNFISNGLLVFISSVWYQSFIFSHVEKIIHNDITVQYKLFIGSWLSIWGFPWYCSSPPIYWTHITLQVSIVPFSFSFILARALVLFYDSFILTNGLIISIPFLEIITAGIYLSTESVSSVLDPHLRNVKALNYVVSIFSWKPSVKDMCIINNFPFYWMF